MMPEGVSSEPTQPSTQTAVLGWGLIMLVTAGIFIGTLMLKPKQRAA